MTSFDRTETFADDEVPGSQTAPAGAPRGATASAAGELEAPTIDRVAEIATLAEAPPEPTSPLPPPPSALPPATLDGAPPRYAIERELGQGAMGKVFRAYDRDIRRRVAMKVLRPDRISPRARTRFVEELQLSGQLEHPGILPVHDAGLGADGRCWYTMRLVDGLTLADVIARLKTGDPQAHAEWSLERRVQLFLQLLHIVGYAHERGVLHRDIKPANIMVGRHGEVFLLDWGVARPLMEGGGAPGGSGERGAGGGPDKIESIRFDGPAPDVTHDGVVIGTPLYMSPEQADGRVDLLGPRSDLYSLAVVLYELLTLQSYLLPLDPGIKASEVLEKVKHFVPVPAESRRHPAQRPVPRPLSLVVEKGLAKAPDDRFQTAQEFADALMEVVERRHRVVCTTTGLSRALSAVDRALDRHHKLVIAGLAATVLFSVIGFAVVVLLIVDALTA